MSLSYKYVFLCFLAALLSACSGYHKLLNDEVWLKDESSLTGTILMADSSRLKLMRMDESVSVVSWDNIDSVQGKKYRTWWAGCNFGYYHTPYFSVFRNEAMTGEAWGMQLKGGISLRKRRLLYGQFTTSWATPYGITKFGMGAQRYSRRTSYLSPFAFFWGSEFNGMNAKNNNGLQYALEPFLGIEQKLNEHFRLHLKFALQINLASKNENAGFNLTLGLHAFKRNFKKYYGILNRERRLPQVKYYGFQLK